MGFWNHRVKGPSWYERMATRKKHTGRKRNLRAPIFTHQQIGGSWHGIGFLKSTHTPEMYFLMLGHIFWKFSKHHHQGLVMYSNTKASEQHSHSYHCTYFIDIVISVAYLAVWKVILHGCFSKTESFLWKTFSQKLMLEFLLALFFFFSRKAQRNLGMLLTRNRLSTWSFELSLNFLTWFWHLPWCS